MSTAASAPQRSPIRHVLVSWREPYGDNRERLVDIEAATPDSFNPDGSGVWKLTRLKQGKWDQNYATGWGMEAPGAKDTVAAITDAVQTAAFRKLPKSAPYDKPFPPADEAWIRVAHTNLDRNDNWYRFPLANLPAPAADVIAAAKELKSVLPRHKTWRYP